MSARLLRPAGLLGLEGIFEFFQVYVIEFHTVNLTLCHITSQCEDKLNTYIVDLLSEAVPNLYTRMSD